MKKIIYALIAVLLLAVSVSASPPDTPLSVGSSGLSIASGTVFSVQGLVMTPSADITITDNSLTFSATAITNGSDQSINRVYSFASPISSFSGVIGIMYSIGELNSNTESTMQLAYNPLSTGGSLVVTGGSNTGLAGSYYVSNTLSSTDLGLVTGISCISPSITSQSTATQSECVDGTFSPITVTASGDDLSYQWYSNASNSNSGGTSLGSNDGADTYSYTPQTTIGGSLYYYCVVTGTCGSDTSAASGEFVVIPLPTASINGTVSVCKDATAPDITFTGADGTAPYTFTYKINTGSDLTVTTTTGNSVTVSAPTSATGTFTYTLLSVEDANCSQLQTGSAEITVNTQPEAEIIINGTSVGWNYSVEFCNDETMSFNLGQTMVSGAYPLQSITWVTTFNGSPAPSLSGTEAAVGAGFDFNFTDNTLPAGEYVFSITELTDANGCNPSSYAPYSASIRIYNNFSPGSILSTGEAICYNEDPAEISGQSGGSIDNGSIVNSIGTGFGGNDESVIRVGGNIYGFGFAQASNFSVMDDFILPTDKTINSIQFQGYQTGSTTTSTFTALYFQIYDGEPGAGGNVIWGDLTTNRLTSSSFSNIYRVTSAGGGTTRPVMDIFCEGLSISLDAGTYWLEWQAAGTLLSGPWQPPTSSPTGNARQYSSQGNNALVDAGGIELPFILNCASMVEASGGDETITYQWQYQETGSATWTTISNSNSATYNPGPLTITTTFRRQAKDGTCNTNWETSSGTWTVVVNPEPQAEIVINGTSVGWNYAEEFCNNETMSFNLGQTMVSGAYPLQSITWVTTYNGSPAPSLSGTETTVGAGFDFNFADNTLAAGEYVISITELTDANGCNPSSYAPYSASITINPSPTATIESNDPVCLGNEIQLSGVYDEVSCNTNCDVPITYCTSYSSIGNYQYISKFKLNSTQNLSGEGTYTANTQSSFKTLYLDSTYNATITISGPFNYPHYTMIYADWNRDGDFDDAGESNEIGYLAGIGDVTNTITVPSNAVLGQTLLRVINRKNSYAPACGNYPVGETEDYLIDVKTVDVNSITDYSWSGPSGLHSGKYWTINPSTENDGGTYNLTVTNVFGCSNQTSHTVIVANPQIDFTQVDTDQEAPFAIQLLPGQFDSYTWSDGSTESSLIVNDFGTYTVTVTQFGCTDSESIILNEVQFISLPQGWSMFSTYINQTADIADVTSAITNSILIIKNNSGQTYWPSMNINTINNMIIGQGYQVKMNNPEVLSIVGISVVPENTPIVLNSGVNMIGVLRHSPVSAVELFAPIIQNLILVKLNNGMVYLPQYGINQIEYLFPDNAFKVIMAAADILTYPANGNYLPAKENQLPVEPMYYDIPVNSGSNMTLVLPLSAIDNLVEMGDEIAVISDNGTVVGAAVFENQTLAIAVWGNDETKFEKSSFGRDHSFHLELYHAKTNRITTIDKIEWETGSEYYVENSLAVVKSINEQQSLEIALYPNPVQEELSVLLTGIKSSHVPIHIYDAVGRLVVDYTAVTNADGKTDIRLNASKLSAGNYYLEVIDNESSTKIHFIKQ